MDGARRTYIATRVGSNSTKLLILIYFVLQPEEVPQFDNGT